jgi:hypothetical protein
MCNSKDPYLLLSSAGSEQFIEKIERLTGRDLVKRKAGRPHKRAS